MGLDDASDIGMRVVMEIMEEVCEVAFLKAEPFREADVNVSRKKLLDGHTQEADGPSKGPEGELNNQFVKDVPVLSVKKRKALDSLKIDMVADTFSPGVVGSRRGRTASRNEGKVEKSEKGVSEVDVSNKSPPIRSKKNLVKSNDLCDE